MFWRCEGGVVDEMGIGRDVKLVFVDTRRWFRRDRFDGRSDGE